MNEKNELNTNLDPEVEKIRDQIISKIGDKPLEEVNKIIKKYGSMSKMFIRGSNENRSIIKIDEIVT